MPCPPAREHQDQPEHPGQRQPVAGVVGARPEPEHDHGGAGQRHRRRDAPELLGRGEPRQAVQAEGGKDGQRHEGSQRDQQHRGDAQRVVPEGDDSGQSDGREQGQDVREADSESQPLVEAYRSTRHDDRALGLCNLDVSFASEQTLS